SPATCWRAWRRPGGRCPDGGFGRARRPPACDHASHAGTTRRCGGARSAAGSRRSAVADPIEIGAIHHLRLTVTDVARSREFYTTLLGFDVAVESPPRDDPDFESIYPVLWGGVVMVRGGLLMGLRPVAPDGDRFSEDRVGLDHLSFSVASRADLERAVEL